MKIRAALAFVSILTCAPGYGAIITYSGVLSGANEAVPNASPGTGLAIVTVDDILNTLTVHVDFSGLVDLSSASHIHCCLPDTTVATTVPTFAGFPLNVTSGTYNNVLDLTATSSYNPAFVTAKGGTVADAKAALIAGLAAGKAYLNVHSKTFPAGELRANLALTPEPGTMALFGIATIGMMYLLRRSTRNAKLQ